RDLDFVNKYGLGNVPVVCPPDVDPKTFVITDVAYDGDGRMINSRFLDGMTIEQAKDEVARRLEKAMYNAAPIGKRQVNYRLRDRRRLGAARGRHDGHVRRPIVVLDPLHRSVARDGADRSRGVGPLDGSRPVHRRHRARDSAPAVLALLHPRHEGNGSYRPR